MRDDTTGAATTDAGREVTKSDAEWRASLSPEQYQILRQAGTERAFTGKYWNFDGEGRYVCAGCGQELFDSDAKFDSHCGWPSFYQSMSPDRVEMREDDSFGMRRTEVVCRRCGGHLGHVFNDAPQTPTGLRFCINSASIDFREEGA